MGAAISDVSWGATFQQFSRRKTNLSIFSQGTSHEAHLFGLEPFTTYHIGVVAANQAGEVSSPWTLVRTSESSPSGLSHFTVEQKENGRALFVRWPEPRRTNGVITVMPAPRGAWSRARCPPGKPVSPGMPSGHGGTAPCTASVLSIAPPGARSEIREE